MEDFKYKLIVAIAAVSWMGPSLIAEASSGARQQPTPQETVKDIHIANQRAPDAVPAVVPDTTPSRSQKTAKNDVNGLKVKQRKVAKESAIDMDRPINTEPTAP